MSRKPLHVAAAALIAVAFSLSFAHADDKPQTSPAPAQTATDAQNDNAAQTDAEAQRAAEEQAQREAYMRAITPGEPHERLQKLVGKWRIEAKQWNGPGEPFVMYGIATVESVLRGRFILEQAHVELPSVIMETHRLTGYDNIKDKYVQFWADNISTNIRNTEGDYDEATKTLTSYGTTLRPGGIEMKIRMVEREIDDNTRIAEVFTTEPGQEETRSAEITYTRVTD